MGFLNLSRSLLIKCLSSPKASAFKGIFEGVCLCLFIQVHSMDFDDTWHPATHPSGAVLPVLTALSEALPQTPKFSGLDLLLAFNVGIEVQGRLMHFSTEAKDIPKRYSERLCHQGEPHCPLSVRGCRCRAVWLRSWLCCCYYCCKVDHFSATEQALWRYRKIWKRL